MATYDERPFTVMMAFRRTARLMVDELVRRLEADGYRGVQPAYHAVFENIDPGGTRLSNLAARADMTHESMSELVATLERRGWVERGSTQPIAVPGSSAHAKGHSRLVGPCTTSTRSNANGRNAEQSRLPRSTRPMLEDALKQRGAPMVN